MIYLPIRSATNEPPSDPIAPPTRNIDTIDDHNMSRPASDKAVP